jgi:hybrid cluster-associated redox disulfide protein
MKITKNMFLYDVVKNNPETVPVFMDFGVHCFGCSIAKFETVEVGAVAHGIDPEKLVEALNDAVEKDIFHINKRKWKEIDE